MITVRTVGIDVKIHSVFKAEPGRISFGGALAELTETSYAEFFTSLILLPKAVQKSTISSSSVNISFYNYKPLSF